MKRGVQEVSTSSEASTPPGVSQGLPKKSRTTHRKQLVASHVVKPFSLIKEVPIEVLLQIMQKLDRTSLVRFSQIDKAAYEVARDPIFCRQYLLNYIPGARKALPETMHPWDFFHDIYTQYEMAVSHVFTLDIFRYDYISKQEIQAGITGDCETISKIEDIQKKNLLTALGYICGNITALTNDNSDLISRSEREMVFLLNVAIGNKEAIDSILLNETPYPDRINLPHNISDFAMGDGLVLAAKLGHLNCIKAIFENNHIYVAFNVAEAFLQACEQKQYSTILYILEKSSDNVSRDHLLRALCHAIRAQNNEVISTIEKHIIETVGAQESQQILNEAATQLQDDDNYMQSILGSDTEHHAVEDWGFERGEDENAELPSTPRGSY